LKTIILFTGAGSTGKTTMLKALETHFSKQFKVSVISEFIRTLIDRKVLDKVDIGADNNNQVIITAELMCRFFEKILNKGQLIIAERSPVDTLAYSRHRKDSTQYVNELNERFLKVIYGFKGVKIITFYFPPILPFEEDGVRNKEGQKIIDMEICKILEEFNIDYITVSNPNFVDRFNFIKDKIFERFQISSRV